MKLHSLHVENWHCRVYVHTHTHTHTHTHSHFYGSVEFVRDNPGKSVPEETFNRSHQSWSSIVPYLLPLSIRIHGRVYVCECKCCRLLYGDQAKYFEQELKPRIKHTNLGQISMVNNGCNMHGSQVSFCHWEHARLKYFTALTVLGSALEISIQHTHPHAHAHTPVDL